MKRTNGILGSHGLKMDQTIAFKNIKQHHQDILFVALGIQHQELEVQIKEAEHRVECYCTVFDGNNCYWKQVDFHI